ncbi:MAG: TonB-dependent receptor [Polyangiaceae bacterium]
MTAAGAAAAGIGPAYGAPAAAAGVGPGSPPPAAAATSGASNASGGVAVGAGCASPARVSGGASAQVGCAAPASLSGGAAGPSPPASSAVGPPTAEVTVRGRRSTPRDIGSETVRGADVRSVPGTFGDPFQSIAALPGVTLTASGLPYFYVRGAPPADTGYYLDGIPLPTLFHIGPGASVVPPALVGNIEFFPGAAPARYGRYAGGIIAGQTTPPSASARGEASVRLFDASAFVESPIGDSASVLAAGRYGYPNLLLSVFARDLSLHYGDYTFRLTYRLTESDSLTIFAIGGYDEESDTQNFSPIDSQFHRLDLRFDRRWVDGSLRVGTTLGFDRTQQSFESGSDEIVSETSARLRVEIEERLGRAAYLSAGVDGNAERYGYAYTQGAEITSPIDIEEVGGAYADLDFRPARPIDVVPGVRVDAYRTLGHVKPSVDPKLAVRLGIPKPVTWVSTVGVAHQEPAYVVPVPGLRVDPTSGLQAVYQMAQGVEANLPSAMFASLTGFYDVDHNTSDFASECGTITADCNLVDRVDGRTYGMEVLLRRSLGQRLSGWISYTLSRAERRIGNVPYLSPFDRPHVLSAVLRYDWGSGADAGVRFTYYSGRPDIPATVLADGAQVATPFPEPSAQRRLPGYYRIDLRAEKRWALSGNKWLAIVFDFFNATLSEEALGYQYNLAARTTTTQTVGPIALPSLGVEAGF